MNGDSRTCSNRERGHAPTKRRRFAVAALLGCVASAFAYLQYLRTPNGHLDFSTVWFASTQMLRGVDPYPLVGPGLQFDFPWNLPYPLTAAALVFPLGSLPELEAALIFVGVSAALLTYALTDVDWNRLWILASSPFVIAVMAAQWSPLYCAALLLPPLAFVVAAKPTLGLAVVAASRSGSALWFAVFGMIVLVAISWLALPNWPASWLSTMRVHSSEYAPVLTWLGGPILLLALLRWRTAQAWLLIAMSVIPITAGWYEVLPLLLIASSKRECQVVSLVTSAGYLLQGAFLSSDGTVSVEITKRLMVAFAYCPALLLILSRPNTGDPPAWLRSISKKPGQN